jgi:hypothetical protein
MRGRYRTVLCKLMADDWMGNNHDCDHGTHGRCEHSFRRRRDAIDLRLTKLTTKAK